MAGRGDGGGVLSYCMRSRLSESHRPTCEASTCWQTFVVHHGNCGDDRDPSDGIRSHSRLESEPPRRFLRSSPGHAEVVAGVEAGRTVAHRTIKLAADWGGYTPGDDGDFALVLGEMSAFFRAHTPEFSGLRHSRRATQRSEFGGKDRRRRLILAMGVCVREFLQDAGVQPSIGRFMTMMTIVRVRHRWR